MSSADDTHVEGPGPTFVQNRHRIDALLAAHTAQLGGRIAITDPDALVRGIAGLIDDCIQEFIAADRSND